MGYGVKQLLFPKKPGLPSEGKKEEVPQDIPVTWTPLQTAAVGAFHFRNWDVNDIDFNATDKDGKSVLHHYAAWVSENPARVKAFDVAIITELLYQVKINPKIESKSGKMAFELMSPPPRENVKGDINAFHLYQILKKAVDEGITKEDVEATKKDDFKEAREAFGHF